MTKTMGEKADMADDLGRPVPPHGSGGGSIHRNDPDETAGRALYRSRANAEARRSIAQARKVRLLSEAGREALNLSEGQQRMVLGSEPSDRDPTDGAGVELWTGADYAIARSLERRGFGSVEGPGQPKGMPGPYFNNADGLSLRESLMIGAPDAD